MSESSLTQITKPLSCFYHIAKYHATVHVVLKHAEKIIIVFLISTHTNTLPAIAMKMKVQTNRFQNNSKLINNICFVYNGLLPRPWDVPYGTCFPDLGK